MALGSNEKTYAKTITLQVAVESPLSKMGVMALLRHSATVVPAVHSCDELPQTQVAVSVSSLHVLRVKSEPSPQVLSLAPQKHLPWSVPAAVTQRGNHVGQSALAAHAAHAGALGSVTESHLGVAEPAVLSHASLEPHLHVPDAPAESHVLEDSALQIPVSGKVVPVLH